MEYRKIIFSDHAVDRMQERTIIDPRYVELLDLNHRVKKQIRKKMGAKSWRDHQSTHRYQMTVQDDFVTIYVFKILHNKKYKLITAYWLDKQR